MDPIRNPYAPGAGNPPPELAGRQELLENAKILLGRLARGNPVQSMVLVGLRGVGKTVLLTEIAKMARSNGYTSIQIEAHEGKSLAELLIPSLQELLYELSAVEKSKLLARRGLRILKSFIGTLEVTVEGVTYGLSVDPEPGVADSGDLEADLPRLLVAVGEAAQAANRVIAILLDEIQYLEPREFSALIMGLHRVNQNQLPLTLIAAGLPQTLALAGNSKSYAERLFTYPDVGALSDDDAAAAIVQPAEDEGVVFDRDAVAAVLDATQSYPYFLQQWAYDAWNCAEGDHITVQDVEAATVKSIGELDRSFFKVRFDRCTPSEKRYMRALAQLGPGKQRSGEVAEILKLKVTSLGPVRNNLIRKGMIYSPAHGDTEFTVPMFDAYMMRAMPDGIGGA